jgi:hypothetical protein
METWRVAEQVLLTWRLGERSLAHALLRRRDQYSIQEDERTIYEYRGSQSVQENDAAAIYAFKDWFIIIFVLRVQLEGCYSLTMEV